MEDQRFVVRVAVGLALGAALVHVWAMPGHFAEWWGYGAFFLLVAVAQGLYGLALLVRPGRALFFLGIGGNLAVVALYVVTRTVGVPFFGPHAGEVEAVGITDSVATVLEVALVVALGALSRTAWLPKVSSPVGPVWGSGVARVGAVGSG
ncbi:MAG: hypothetical protein H0X57_13740, partial [Rubrobacter sp.]|nr:hypothetical protein [Rubrobacter sp.]